jgi:hypothetical protein
MTLYLAENSSYLSCWPNLLGYAGVKERMYDCLEQELEAESPLLSEILNQKFGFESYWDEPRFQNILRRLNERINTKSVATI